MQLEKKIDDLLARMTLDEKVSLLTGRDCMDTRTISRLGVAALKMADGPHGLRWDHATCFPTGIAMGASWNPPLIEQMGGALARETLAKGRNVILGPCVNIHRTPLGGRNFESFGEDPYLAARMTVAYVNGVQQQGVGTSTKHLACNNQECNRMTVSAEVDERTLREIYLPAFKAAVREADTWTVMAAYNRLNGAYCCANEHLLNDILKKEWKFEGLVVSDWGAVHGTVDSACAGLDLEMPGPGRYFAEPLREAVDRVDVEMSLIDDKVRRMLRVMGRMGLLEDNYQPPEGALNTDEHRNIARRVAEESIVLLKNENRLLPFDPSGMRKLAVVGPNAAVARLGGGGSSTVTPFQCVTPLQALEEKCRQHDIEVLYALGCGMPSDLPPVDRQYLRTPDGEAGIKAEYFDNPEMQGEPVIVRTEENVYFDWGGGAPDPSLKNNCFAARWTGQLVPETDGKYEIGLIAYDDMLCYVNGELLIECRPDPLAVIKTVTLDAQAGVPMDLRIEYFARNGWPVAKFGWVPVQDMQQAVDLAAEADAVVMVGGLSASYEGEGVDRRELCLPGRQDELIQKLLEVNPATAVVLVSGTPVTMEGWKDRVPALVEAWYPGQEGGFAIADVLFGDVNPSGKLTVTFPRQLEDNPSHGHYPGDREVRYTEGIYVGYRHYDKHQIEPLFPFGHGLSYTTFAYEDLQAEKAENGSVQVRCRIRNTGDCRGSEVVQLYVGDPESRLDRPPCELKAFRKMALDPGEDSVMEWELREEAFSYYDPEAGAWVLEPGAFHIMAGSSSRDIRKTIVIEM